MRGVVLGLCRLSDARLPLVICFDQFEGLQQVLHDNASFLKFAEVVSALRHEENGALLLVSFIQSAFRDQLKEAGGDALWAARGRKRDDPFPPDPRPGRTPGGVPTIRLTGAAEMPPRGS